MNIIFLDFDGVLNNKEDFFVNKLFSPNNMEQLAILVNNTNAYFVLTTTHRNNEMMIIEFQKQCKKYNIDGRIVGKTPSLPLNGLKNKDVRPKEIKLWLNYYLDKIKNWVVLDDMNLVIDNFVKTDYKFGLVNKKVIDAIKYLNK